MARILIAEDRESMRKALRALFLTRPHSEVCGEAEDWQRGGQESSSIASRFDRYRFMTWTR